MLSSRKKTANGAILPQLANQCFTHFFSSFTFKSLDPDSVSFEVVCLKKRLIFAQAYLRYDQATYLQMYSPVSAQPHVRHLKQLTCHCLSRASRDWPCLISSPQPAQSGGEESREEKQEAQQWERWEQAGTLWAFMHLSFPLYVLAILLCQPLITSLPPSPLLLIPLSCRDSHTVSARWSYQNQATRLPEAAGHLLWLWVCLQVSPCGYTPTKMVCFCSVQQVDITTLHVHLQENKHAGW